MLPGVDDEGRLEEINPIHVYDLPQTYERPTSDQIISALQSLRVPIQPWGTNDTSTTARPIDPTGVHQYLTNFISSPLQWLTDEQREQVWDLASLRIAERAGRSGMGAMDRTFSIPAWKGDQAQVDLVLHEPSLTEDNLGHKTWASAYVLARKHQLLEDCHDRIRHSPFGGRYEVLELGAGTGLVGMTIAAMLGVPVLLSDLGGIEQNLARNIERNADVITAHDGVARTGILDWQDPQKVQIRQPDGQFGLQSESLASPLIVAADPIYDSEHPAWLAQTIAYHLARATPARAVVTIAMREAFGHERADFIAQMKHHGLMLYAEDHDRGYDDWGRADGGRASVDCWTSIWAWPDTVIRATITR